MNTEFNIDIYKIVFRGSRSIIPSERYFQASDPVEALKDFYFTFYRGRIHTKRLTITHIQIYNRFSNKWLDRMSEAVAGVDRNIKDSMSIKLDSEGKPNKIKLTKD